MCNRVSTPTIDEMHGYFDKQEVNQGRIFQIDAFEPFYHAQAFGMPWLPHISADNDRRIAPAMWKFLPERASLEVFKKYETCNAKAEEIFSKTTYKKYIGTNRGLMVLKGFFEGMGMPDGTSQPYFIYPANGDLLTLGTVYSDWYDDNLGALVRTFSLITTEANKRMAEIHNKKKRMPLVILPNARDKWLGRLAQPEIEQMMQPLPDGYLADHKVSRDLYRPKINTNTPDILKPIQTGELF